jgi:Flp pilus assembly protein protease CpaA
VFEITMSSLLVMATTVIVLSVFSYFDIRYRRVPNRVILAGALIGSAVVVLSGHMLLYARLHLLALFMVAPLAYALWRAGSLGGADAKSLIVVALLSPGLEFAEWDIPFIEVTLGDWLRILLMLLFGLLYQRTNAQPQSATSAEKPIPLIPFLLLSYVLSQFLALL